MDSPKIFQLEINHIVLHNTGRSSEAERLVWDQEAGIAKFPALTIIQPPILGGLNVYQITGRAGLPGDRFR